MFFWGSRFQRLLLDVFINREYKADDPTVKRIMRELDAQPARLQELANAKYTILSIINTWQPDQYKKALEQILDPTAPLGKIFLTKRGLIGTPSISHGALKIAHDALKKFTENTEVSESKETKLTR